MADRSIPRRRLLHRSVLAGAGMALTRSLSAATALAGSKRLHVACNSYSWTVFYKREGRDFNQSLDAGLAELAASGLDGYEPGINSPDEIDRLKPLLVKHGLEMRSLYVNSTLHEADRADASIADILKVARKAQAIGTRIVVTNPSPIQWSGTRDKNDTQLATQAAALNRLGSALRDLGMTLAYHNHDMELRAAAREFHHMMLATDSEKVTLCLDAHWIYRGAGNSQVALFDIVKLYGSRISELHLRQSRDGVWSETFSPGDIDYAALVAALNEQGVRRPHVVLEQAVEKGTPATMKSFDAFKQSSEHVRRLFARR